MRSLFSYRLTIILIIFTLLFCADPIAASEGDEVWESVENFLRWEKRWFNTFYCENCYQKKVGKNVVIRYETTSEDFSENDASGRQQTVQKKTVYIGIDNSVLQYRVVGFSKNPNRKLRANIIPVETSSGDECRPENIGSVSNEEGFDYIINPIESIISTVPYNDSVNEIVKNAVRRSMQNYDKSTSLRSVLLLGKYELADPFLLVYDTSKKQLYQLDFPSVDVLRSDDFYMEVYSAGVYMGSDLTDEKRLKISKIEAFAIEKLNNFSIPIDIGGPVK